MIKIINFILICSELNPLKNLIKLSLIKTNSIFKINIIQVFINNIIDLLVNTLNIKNIDNLKEETILTINKLLVNLKKVSFPINLAFERFDENKNGYLSIKVHIQSLGICSIR